MENREVIYTKCEAVRNLNSVEGFNPLDYITTSTNERGEEYVNLDTKYRHLWFRLCNPNGKITKKILRLDDKVAAVEARVYLNKDDPEDNYISSGSAQRFYDPNNHLGAFYLETAETIAEGRALAKAGYGIQFCDVDGQRDESMPEMGIKSAVSTTKKRETVNQGKPSIPSQETKQLAEQPKQPTQQVKQTVVAEKQVKNSENDVPKTESVQSVDLTEKNVLPPVEQTEDNSVKLAIDLTPNGTYDSSTPVEEILKIMTIAEAEDVDITAGFNKGKKIRQVYLTNYRHLKWFFEVYNGEDNKLRAAAKLLYDIAVQQKAG